MLAHDILIVKVLRKFVDMMASHFGPEVGELGLESGSLFDHINFIKYVSQWQLQLKYNDIHHQWPDMI